MKVIKLKKIEFYGYAFTCPKCHTHIEIQHKCPLELHQTKLMVCWKCGQHFNLEYDPQD